MIRRRPRSTLFPYRTLSRSLVKVMKQPRIDVGPIVNRHGSLLRTARGTSPVIMSERLGRNRLDGIRFASAPIPDRLPRSGRSEEHTSELQSQSNIVCRLLLE